VFCLAILANATLAEMTRHKRKFTGLKKDIQNIPKSQHDDQIRGLDREIKDYVSLFKSTFEQLFSWAEFMMSKVDFREITDSIFDSSSVI